MENHSNLNEYHNISNNDVHIQYIRLCFAGFFCQGIQGFHEYLHTTPMTIVLSAFFPRQPLHFENVVNCVVMRTSFISITANRRILYSALLVQILLKRSGFFVSATIYFGCNNSVGLG